MRCVVTGQQTAVAELSQNKKRREKATSLVYIDRFNESIIGKFKLRIQ